MLYSIGKFAKEIGVTTKTLRNWHESGHRYYSELQLKDYLGENYAKNL